MMKSRRVVSSCRRNLYGSCWPHTVADSPSQTVPREAGGHTTSCASPTNQNSEVSLSAWVEARVMSPGRRSFHLKAPPRKRCPNLVLSLWLAFTVISVRKVKLGAKRGLFSTSHLEPLTARCWIPEELGVQGFFDALNGAGVSYSVLRWFDGLPHLEKGEDIDLLVSDTDTLFLRSLLSQRTKAAVPVDVYSPSGHNFTGWNGIRYFPPTLSEMILSSSSQGPNGVRRPNPSAYFYGLAYHVVYHKGHKAGIPSRKFPASLVHTSDHNYLSELRDAADKARIGFNDHSLEGLEELLKTQNCEPQIDGLEFFGVSNSFIRDSLMSDLVDAAGPMDGVTAFIVRENGVQYLPDIERIITQSGFEILESIPLFGAQADAARSNTRGGNWAAAPYPVSGGDPAHLFVGLDVFPDYPKQLGQGKYPFSTNMRTERTKVSIRDYCNRKRSAFLALNVIHATDNALSVTHFLVSVLGAERAANFAAIAMSAAKDVEVQPAVVDRLGGHSRRAIVGRAGSLSDGQPTVIKVFRPAHLDSLQSELEARKYCETFPEILPILDRGKNWFSTPLVVDAQKILAFSPQEALRVRAFLLACAANGDMAIDFTPKNMLHDKEGSLVFLDFEFFQASEPRMSLWRSPALFGLENSSPLRRPAPFRKEKRFYFHHWFRYTLVPRWVFVSSSSERTYSAFQILSKAYLRVRGSMPKITRLVAFIVRIRAEIIRRILIAKRG